jgi:hypothetical protein
MTRRRAWLIGAVVGPVIGVALLVGLAAWLERPEHLKARIERAVSANLHLTTTIGALAVHYRKRASFEASGIELRVPDRPDLPPFIAIDRLSVEANPVRLATELLRGRVAFVEVDGLRITIPPGDDSHPALRALGGHTAGQPAAQRSRIIIDEFETHDAVLTVLRRGARHPPLVFKIRDLALHDLAFNQAIPFRADLTNPVPEGEVISTGTVGPWQTAPTDLPLDGAYTFRHADLDPLPGVGGLLASTGHYTGTLGEIRVAGQTTTPNFSLDLGGKPVPLSTTFTAVVNGANGTTHLEAVDAVLFHTHIHVSGDIVNLPGPAGFDIALKAKIAHGRIEDILRLAMDTPQPPFTGDVSIDARVRVPAGSSRPRDRLVLDGRFALLKTHFTDGEVEQKLETLSQRGQGLDASAPLSRVATNLTGQFRLTAQSVALPDLSFDVPGATVLLDGSYTLPTQDMAFEGELRTEASLSNVVGGFKSILIKPFDWLFRRDGAGAVIPIRIDGTRDHPKIAVRIGAALSRGK